MKYTVGLEIMFDNVENIINGVWLSTSKKYRIVNIAANGSALIKSEQDDYPMGLLQKEFEHARVVA